MLRSIKQLLGVKLGAKDGVVGHVKDFYFNDTSWAVRYLVADTGSWISKRLVLVAPHAFGSFDTDGKSLCVELTKKQIEDSPALDSGQLVSRPFEEAYYAYYGWPAYWEGGAMWGLSDLPVLLPAPAAPSAATGGQRVQAATHLHSAQALMAFDVQAGGGDIGRVFDLVVDDRNWAVRHLVVETGNMLSGKPVMISPERISRIAHEESKVFVDMTTADILMSPAYAAAALNET